MYLDYVKEREGFETLETEHGFAIFKIKGEECYIKEIYVKKEFRKEKRASSMADKIAAEAKAEGCKILSGSVSLECGDPTASIQVLLAYGFKVYQFHSNLLWFVKHL